MQTVAILLYQDMWTFDLGVATEVWGIDRTDASVPAFDFRRCSVDGQPVQGHGGVVVMPTHDLAGLETADVILAPGREHHGSVLPQPIVDSLAKAYTRRAVIVGMCGGAFTLAQAGLLSGRRATTHWLLADDLRAMHPQVLVEQEDLYLEDDGIWTSAGTASLIDMCLHLVRVQHGASVATLIARRMVTPPHRPGNQRPYIDNPVPPAGRGGATDPVAGVMRWAMENLAAAQSTPELAARAHMSERTFTRKFSELTGTSPQKWLLHQRLMQAQQLLEHTRLTVDTVATRCGFGSAALFRRHFCAYFATTPGEYRRQFGD